DPDDLPKARLTWAALRDTAGLLSYLWPYKVKFGLALGCLFAGSLAGLGFPLLAGNLVDAALVHLRGGVPTGWLQDVNHVALALLGVLGLQAVFAFLRTLWFVEVGERCLA